MRLLTTCVTALAVACSGSTTTTSGPPAHVAGDYTVDVTNTATNQCNFQNWTPNASTNGIPVAVTQTQAGDQAVATVNGLVGDAMLASIGTNSFGGRIAGAQATLTAKGSITGNQGNCAYTTDGTVEATFTGDTMQGTVTYTRVTNGNADCAPLVGCKTVQEFSGARPPSGD